MDGAQMGGAQMGGALAGVLVADFSRVLAGPYATMLLADLGATVIKVERPGSGDDTRGWGPPWGPDGQSTYFTGVNRNKRSLALDLRDPTDAARARRLAAKSDVVISNFTPGTMDALGLGYPALSARSPGIVYCTISGFGDGPGADMPGYDLMVQAMGGLMSITGTEEPTKAGVAVVDVLTGLHACVSILAALHHRDTTGFGQAVEISLLSTLLSGLVNQSAAYAGAGVIPARMGNAHPSICPYEVYPTRDRGMVIAVGNDAQFGVFARLLGLPHLASDERFATNAERVAHRVELNALIAPALLTRGADEWHRDLLTAGIPNGPINDVGEAFTLAEALELDPLVTIPATKGDQHHVANPARYSRTAVEYRLPAPALGQHTDEIVAEFDLDDTHGAEHSP